jgi:uncharacterized membrane protein YdbT with pleckstrin-like domain
MERKELLRIHPSIRNSLALVVWPIVGIFVINFVIKKYIWQEMTFVWMLIIALVLLLFPAYAWIKTRFHTFIVYEKAVSSRKGLVAKNTCEIRISDIRAINVRQGFFDRFLRVGRVGFSSAASGGGGEREDLEEVIFFGARNPEGIKRLVQQQMPGHGDPGSDE